MLRLNCICSEIFVVYLWIGLQNFSSNRVLSLYCCIYVTLHIIMNYESQSLWNILSNNSFTLGKIHCKFFLLTEKTIDF